MIRPASAYLHGIDGVPVVVVTGRTAAWLARHADLNQLRIEHRGVDPDIDAQLVAIATAAAAWRARVGAATGTTLAPTAEPTASSEMTTTAAAARLGVTERAVRKAAAAGRLTGRRIAGRWVFTREDVEHYRAARPT